MASKKGRALLKRCIGSSTDPVAGLNDDEYAEMVLEFGQPQQPLVDFMVR